MYGSPALIYWAQTTGKGLSRKCHFTCSLNPCTRTFNVCFLKGDMVDIPGRCRKEITRSMVWSDIAGRPNGRFKTVQVPEQRSLWRAAWRCKVRRLIFNLPASFVLWCFVPATKSRVTDRLALLSLFRLYAGSACSEWGQRKRHKGTGEGKGEHKVERKK
jgi:hypothetical protein